jgi:hypothetical protein
MARKPKPMTEDDLNVLLDSLVDESDGLRNSDIANDRATALDFYMGEPFGNETEGNSSYVSRDVQDTIEWIMPNLVEIFLSGDNYVEFTAQNDDDVLRAKQETSYVNYVAMRQNPAFTIFHTWFKDALMQKTGIVKYFWEQDDKPVRETYQNITQEELLLMLQDDDTELAEQSVEMVETIDELGETSEQEVITEAVIIRNQKGHGKACYVNIPPEEFIITKRAKSLEDADFVAHRPMITISKLRSMGFEESKIEEIIDGASSKALRS